MYASVVEELRVLIKRYDWKEDFNKAIKKAQSYDVPSIKNIKNLEDYFSWMDKLLHWAPSEKGDSARDVYYKIAEFYFFLDQEPVKSLQNPIKPECEKQLTPLSEWIKNFAATWGSYLDTTESAKEIDTFRKDLLFNWDEYMPTPSGYFTFNQFFARHLKPGMRPIAGLLDNEVIVAPADSTFVGWWQVDEKSNIYVENKLDIKGIHWSIDQLLEGSEYSDRFKGGIFTHSFLNTYDYHRWHTPVQGKVLESRIIQGQAYLNVSVTEKIDNGKKINMLNALDGTGYQFVQTRGLVIIDSPIGLVACLPMGMAQVSSVVITAEEGVTLHKGEELGYFQFGGSDFVMVFERSSNVKLSCRPDVHYSQGICIGKAYPYSFR